MMKQISSIETLNGICIFLLFQVFFLCIIEKSGVSFLKSPHISPKLVFFSSVSATHFRFNLLLFFSSLHLSIVFSFVPVPHDIHSKTGFPGRRHTQSKPTCAVRDDDVCISVWRELEAQSGCHDSIC